MLLVAMPRADHYVTRLSPMGAPLAVLVDATRMQKPQSLGETGVSYGCVMRVLLLPDQWLP